MNTTGRCPAAHPDDLTPCDGPVVVTVLDAQNAGAEGCEHHGARLLASLERGRVYPLPDAPEGAAIRVFKAAGSTRPFAWYENAPRTEPSQLSREENRREAVRAFYRLHQTTAAVAADPFNPGALETLQNAANEANAKMREAGLLDLPQHEVMALVRAEFPDFDPTGGLGDAR